MPSKPATKPNATRIESQPDFFTIADIAVRLNCSTKTIRRRIEAGKLKAKRDGGRLLISRAAYFEYAAALRG